jgi:hypothetical protein
MDSGAGLTSMTTTRYTTTTTFSPACLESLLELQCSDPLELVAIAQIGTGNLLDPLEMLGSQATESQ